VDNAQFAIESAVYEVSMATANTEQEIKGWLLPAINKLIEHICVESVVMSDITISNFTAAVEITEKDTAGKKGSFAFTVKLSKGAETLTTDKIQGVILPVSTVGIAEKTGNSASIRVYPNPTKGQLTIDNGELTMNNVEIYNVVGQKLQSKIVNLQSKIVIDVSHLAKGLYFFESRRKDNAVC
jgi:hypothetical protein